MKAPDESLTEATAPESPSIPNKAPRPNDLQERLTGKVSPEHLNKLIWLLDHARSKQIYTVKATGNLIGYDTATMSRVFNGEYGAKLDNIIKRIDDFRRLEAERVGYGDRPIVLTSLMQEVIALCEVARAANSMAYLIGVAQIGKSESLKHYAENPEYGRTYYVSMPVGGVTRSFILDLARACGLPTKTNAEDIKSRIARFLDPNCLLIIDEFHQAFICGLKKRTIESVRWIHDVTGCGIVLCGTDVLDDLSKEEKHEKFLAQILKRAPIRKYLAPAPTDEDLERIVGAYGFPPLEGEGGDELRAMAQRDGLGPITKYLRLARKMASRRNEPPAWPHFLQTLATFSALPNRTGKRR